MQLLPLIPALTCLLLLAPHSTFQQEDPIVTTALGNIKGKILRTQYGKPIMSFRGIPYAKPPVGALRFAAPQPAEPWNDTLSATSDSLVCPQAGLQQQLMTEDCLVLNVYTRNVSRSAPVMVYIHGGANKIGSGHSLYEAGPQYLFEHDIVLVTFNYRLGALGFLSTGRDSATTGNYGYLDQVLALQWVQAHIASFGGNASSVTILGLSAGAMAVTLHIASPLSANLFHRAIAMSGAATHTYAIDNQYWTRKLAREVSCPMYDADDLVECLREVSWQTIINVCSQWEPYGMINMKWNFEVDGHFLLQHPTQHMETNNFNRVPVIIGLVRNELDYSVFHQENNTRLLHDISTNFHLYAPEFLLYNSSLEETSDERGSISARLWQYYMGAQGTPLTSQNLQKFGEIFSDAILGHGIHRFVQLMHEARNDVYYYMNTYPVRRSNYPANTGNISGIAHADDWQYIMPGLWYGAQFEPNDPEMFMVERMTKLWTGFATYGKPMLEEGDIEWRSSGVDEISTLYIERNLSVAGPPYAERYALWDELFPRSRSGAMRVAASLWSVLALLSLH